MGHNVSGHPEGGYIQQILQMVDEKTFRLSYAAAGHIAFLLMCTASNAVLTKMLSRS